MEPHIPEITTVIQLAVAPVFMLTAVGTIISALSIRLGRAVDRRRVLEQKLQSLSGGEDQDARAELAQIARRVHYVYRSIVFSVVSGIFVCLLIAGAFIGAFVSVDLTRTVAALFVLAVASLTASLLLFLREIFLAVSTPRHIQK
jgi:NADH:ubiquinone oxidoreductase subunit 3 (subunit A)